MRRWQISRSWLLKIFRLSAKEPEFFTRIITEAEPDLDSIEPRSLVLEKRGGTLRWLHFKCPCGCGEIRSVNLMRSKRPFWTVSLDNHGKLSLSPSVWVEGECESHFWIRRNRMIWARL
jgi:hypothetical protein